MSMKSYFFHVLQVMAIVIFSNFLVEWLSEGNINSFLQKPQRFLIAVICISLIGGFLTYRVNKQAQIKESK